MPEATMILLDNSEYSINGDYNPTRWLTETDAAGLLIQTKMDQDPQAAIGVVLTAGKQVEILCTPSTDIGKVSSSLYGIKQHGLIRLANALQTSALALKHRANPTLRQRIICFIASTITETLQQLKLVCKKLKKNGVALDLLLMGDLSQRQKDIAMAMHETVNHQDNSSLIYLDPNDNISDLLLSSKLFSFAAPIPMADEDPDLLMALQLSLQESGTQQHYESPDIMENQQQLANRAMQLAMEQEEPEGQEEDEEERSDKDENNEKD